MDSGTNSLTIIHNRSCASAFEQLVELVYGKPFDVTKVEQAECLFELCLELENNDLAKQFAQYGIYRTLDHETVLPRIRSKMLLGESTTEEMSFIAKTFSLYAPSSLAVLSGSDIYSILCDPCFTVPSEKDLFVAIWKLIQRGLDYVLLLRCVKAEYLYQADIFVSLQDYIPQSADVVNELRTLMRRTRSNPKEPDPDRHRQVLVVRLGETKQYFYADEKIDRIFSNDDDRAKYLIRFNDSYLDPDRTFADYSIPKDAVFTMELKKWHVVVKLLNQRHETVFCNSDSVVRDVMREVGHCTESGMHRIVCHGTKLELDKKLSDYNISKGSTISIEWEHHN